MFRKTSPRTLATGAIRAFRLNFVLLIFLSYFCGFMRRITHFCFLGIFLFLLSSCGGDFKKLLKSTNMEAKMKAADAYYEKRDFAHAQQLFDQLSGFYVGQAEQEKIQYLLAYCHYNLGSIDLASYIFKTFNENYPNSKHAEDAFFMYAYCQYLNSQGTDLDQGSTTKAIETLQLYINLYPDDAKRVAETNELIDKLRDVLEEKAYRNAKLYFQIEDYKAAIVSLGNVIKDFPDIEKKEEIDFLIFKSHYLLALNSVEEAYIDGVYRHLKKERFQSTLENYLVFREMWPQSRYQSEALGIYKKTQTLLTQINKINH